MANKAFSNPKISEFLNHILLKNDSISIFQTSVLTRYKLINAQIGKPHTHAKVLYVFWAKI